MSGASADLSSPASGAKIGADLINRNGYLELTFRAPLGAQIDASSINGDEVTLKDSTGKVIALAAPERVLLENGEGTNSWRYRFTGSLSVGHYTVEIAANSFMDTGMVKNLAEVEVFTLEKGVAALRGFATGATVDRETLNGQGYLDVTFTPTGSNKVDPATLNGDEFTLTGANGENVIVSKTPSQPGALAGTNTWRYTFTGQFDTGKLSLNFKAGSWADTGGTTGGASVQTLQVITKRVPSRLLLTCQKS